MFIFTLCKAFAKDLCTFYIPVPPQIKQKTLMPPAEDKELK